MHPRLLFHLFTFSLALGELTRHAKDETLFLALLSWCATMLLVRQGEGNWRLIMDGASVVLLCVSVAAALEVGRLVLVILLTSSCLPLILAIRARGGSELWSSLEGISNSEPRLTEIPVQDPAVGLARLAQWLQAEGFVRSEWNGSPVWRRGTKLMPPPEFVRVYASAKAVTIEQWVGLNAGNQILVKGTILDGPIGSSLETKLAKRQQVMDALLSDC